MTLQRRIADQALAGERQDRHLHPAAPSEFPVPAYGEQTWCRPGTRPSGIHRTWRGASRSMPAMIPLEQVIARLERAFPGRHVELVPNGSPGNPPSLGVAAEQARVVAQWLRDDPELRLDFASNVTGVDWPERTVEEKHRFTQVVDGVERECKETRERRIPGYLEVVYHLYSMELKHGPLVLRLRTPDRTTRVRLPSLTPIWRSSELQEREIYDLFGVVFDGHPDLRRLLMWEGFRDHPMRKDYVSGSMRRMRSMVVASAGRGRVPPA